MGEARTRIFVTSDGHKRNWTMVSDHSIDLSAARERIRAGGQDPPDDLRYMTSAEAVAAYPQHLRG